MTIAKNIYSRQEDVSMVIEEIKREAVDSWDEPCIKNYEFKDGSIMVVYLDDDNDTAVDYHPHHIVHRPDNEPVLFEDELPYRGLYRSENPLNQVHY